MILDELSIIDHPAHYRMSTGHSPLNIKPLQRRGILNSIFFIMIVLLPAILLLIVFAFLFFREVRLDRKRFLEADRLADEHILREVERFLNAQRGSENQNTVANEKGS